MLSLKISMKMANMGKNLSEAMTCRENHKALTDRATVMSWAAGKGEWKRSELLEPLALLG